MRSQKSNIRGFTLVELVIIFLVVSVLATATFAAYINMRQRSRDVQRISDMANLTKALQLFFTDKSHYPGPTEEGVPDTGEMVGDDLDGAFETSLQRYISYVPQDPRHNGKKYYYAYDPEHLVDDPKGSCNAALGTKAVLGFRTAESSKIELQLETCSDADMNLNEFDYNIGFYPPGP